MGKRLSNKDLKEIAKLKEKKYRKKSAKVLIEGVRLLNEIFDHNILPEKIFYTARHEKIEKIIKAMDFEDCHKLLPDQLKKITYTNSPQGVSAIISANLMPIKYHEKLLYLDDISDPGNLGTIIRTAAAAGLDGVFISPNCVDPFNEKVIRSSMGAVFFTPIEEINYQEIFNQDFNIIVSTLNDTAKHYKTEIPLKEKNLLVIGSEANGVREEIINKATYNITIPMRNRIESLNAAVSAAILISEIFGF